MISFDDFKKVEITVGKILSAEKVPETDKLLKLQVDFGLKPMPSVGIGSPERDVRQIISGIALYFPDPQALVGRKFMFVTNIPPRPIKGLLSNGMILAVSTDDGAFSLLEPNAEIPEGTKAR
jgi:methionyl-tRNA synthetase